MRMTLSLWLAVLLVSVASNVSAQTPVSVLNPTKLVFDKSPDHDAKLPDGSPVVTGYTVHIFEQMASNGSGTSEEIDLGKPTPDANGKITVTVDAFLKLAMKRNFTAVVEAVGPTGKGGSASSLPFVRFGPPLPPANVTPIH